MKKRFTGFTGLLALLLAFSAAPVFATPGTTASATARISFSIPPRVEVREDAGRICADLTSMNDVLDLRTENGTLVPGCAAGQLSEVQGDGAQTLIVTPV